MVIANRLCQEVSSLSFVGKPDDLLRTAQVRFRCVLDERAFRHKMSVEVARHLEQRDRSSLHKTSDTYTDARLEMCVELIAFYHI